MKQFLITGLLALAAVPLATGQTSTFDNQSTWLIPPQTSTIDATNFVNEGVFTVNTPVDINSGDNIYFQTSDTLNYTNSGIMNGSPGFDLQWYPSTVGVAHMSANFVNVPNGLGGGIINCSPASINTGLGFIFALGGATEFRVAATNLINYGTINLDNSGILTVLFGNGGTIGTIGSTVPPALISLKGENVDLSNGTLNFSSNGNFTNSTFGVSALDSGAGTDTNGEWDPYFDLTQNFALSSLFATTALPAPFFQNLFLQNSTPYAENATGNPVGTNLIIWRSVFLQDTSAGNVTKNVYFDGSIVGAGAIHIEWGGTFIDPLTHLPTTNYLYLSDVPGELTQNNVTNVFFIQNGVPQNYSFAESTARLLDPNNATGSSLPTFIPGLVTNFYSYLDLQLVPTLTSTNNIFGGSVTNLPERIEISASRTLNLTGAQISGPDYMSIRSTNQYEGNVGINLIAPYSDISLGVTNGSLSISNLMRPLLPRWSGTIQAFTARWLVTDATGVTNDYRVLLVNSQVVPTSVPQIQDLTLHATNSLTLSDSLNVTRSLFIDARSLTLTTNDSSTLSTVGELNLLSPNVVWSPSLPNLQYLTNSGVITAGNLMNFAGNMTSPYSNPNMATPYQSFVNHGVVTNQGSFIVANYFSNDGVFQNNTNGNITVRANCAFLTNGMFSAPSGAGNITVAANSLVISNHSLLAGGTLSITASNCFSDGSSLFNMFGHVVTTNTPVLNTVSNGNFWTAGGSLVTPALPATGDLLGTTISNTVPPFVSALTVWAGQDRGCAPTGYVNNLAIGRLILNGNTGSKFSFAGTGVGKALYVDRIELDGTAANNFGAGNVTNILFGSNFRIYYAQALANGVSIAEKLAGANAGHFIWVSNYAGIFSATNVSYLDGNSYTFNQALVESCNIDSRQGLPGDNGLPNCSSKAGSPIQDPIPTNWIFDVVVSNAPCGCTTNTGAGSGSIASLPNSGYPGGNDPTILPFLGTNSSAGVVSNLFALTQGNYNGLFYDKTNGVATSSAGYLRAMVTKSGKVSGSLSLAGKNYPVTGAFDASGHLVKTNLRAGNNSLRLNLDMQLDFVGGDQINGTVTSSNWLATLRADKLGANSHSGRYTFVIPGDTINSTDSPAGHGFGTLVVKTNGVLQWSGMLGDGTSIPESQLSGVSSQGVWPLYYTPYGNHGLVLGWIQFDTNQPGSDLSGETIWIKPGGLAGKNLNYYPEGFTNQIEVVGSQYVQPPVTASNGMVVLSGGNLGVPKTNSFTLRPNFTVNGKPFSFSIAKKSGLLSGVETTTVRKNTSFQGVLLQKLEAGYGFFLGTNQSGQLEYDPLP